MLYQYKLTTVHISLIYYSSLCLLQMVLKFGFFDVYPWPFLVLFTLPFYRSWEQPLYGTDAIYENLKTDRRQLRGFHVLNTCTAYFVALKTGKDDPKREKAEKKRGLFFDSSKAQRIRSSKKRNGRFKTSGLN